MERDLEEITNSCSKKQEQADKTKKKVHTKEKKRKREDGEEDEETDEDEDINIRDGEKVFTRSRTSKIHYQNIVKEMEYLKGLPMPLITASMVDWVLECEIKRSKYKNINGNVARQMREYLIKLYCVIGEVQKRQSSSEVDKLKKQMEDMKIYVNALKEENLKLKKELETIKNKMNHPTSVEPSGHPLIKKNINKERGKGKGINNSNGKRSTGKRNS